MNWSNLRKKMRPIWLVICSLFTWGAAANTGIGFSGFIFGIPFAWSLFSRTRHLSRTYRVLILGFALSPLIAAFVFPAVTNRLHYPIIGAEVIVPSGWGSVTYPKDASSYLSTPEELRKEGYRGAANQGYITTVFQHTVSLRLTGVKTQIPDFGLVYYAVLSDPSGKVYEIREADLLAAANAGHLKAAALNNVKTLHRPMMRYLSNLMYWPIVPMLLATWTSSTIRTYLNTW
jgi:hypothetical protein